MTMTNHHPAIVSNCPVRRISKNGAAYLDRYLISHSDTGIQNWLHHFHTADGDDALHNHPWRGYAKVARGGYWEQVLGADGPRVSWRGPDDGIRRIDENTWHRILRVDPGTITRLCVLPGRRQEWFFLHPGPGATKTPTILSQPGWRRDPVKTAGEHWYKDCPTATHLLGADEWL